MKVTVQQVELVESVYRNLWYIKISADMTVDQNHKSTNIKNFKEEWAGEVEPCPLPHWFCMSFKVSCQLKDKRFERTVA